MRRALPGRLVIVDAAPDNRQEYGHGQQHLLDDAAQVLAELRFDGQESGNERQSNRQEQNARLSYNERPLIDAEDDADEEHYANHTSPPEVDEALGQRPDRDGDAVEPTLSGQAVRHLIELVRVVDGWLVRPEHPRNQRDGHEPVGAAFLEGDL